MKAKTLRTSFVYRVFLDTFILTSLLAIAHNLAAIWMPPASDARALGFFCGDASLSYPYIGNTVSRRTLYRIGQHAPLLAILTVELVRYRSETCSRQPPLHASVASHLVPFLLQLYPPLSCFLFGYATERIFRTISKTCFPRLRPHFFDVCQPLLPGGETCDSIEIAASLQHRFITNYTCATGRGDALSHDMLSGLSSSFPSGHASLACYGMLFVALYLQQRVVSRRTQLLRPLLQTGCLLVAWYVSLSRLWDHMHHASDVAVGAALGTAIAVAAAQFVGDAGCSLVTPTTEELEKAARDAEVGKNAAAAGRRDQRKAADATSELLSPLDGAA